MTNYDLKVEITSRSGESIERHLALSTVHNQQTYIQRKLYQVLPISGNDARTLARFGTITLFLPQPEGEVNDQGFYSNSRERITYTLKKLES